MYHLRLKGAHYEMGVKRGKLLKRNGIIFPLQLDDFQLAHGVESEKILRNHFPEVCEEIRGLYGFCFSHKGSCGADRCFFRERGQGDLR